MATAREAENNFNQVCPPDMTGRITAFPPEAITFQINQLGQQLKDAAGKPEEPSLKDRVEKFQKLQQFSQAYVDARRGAAFAEHKRSLWEFERRRAIVPTAISAGVTLLGLVLLIFGFPRKQKPVETKFPGI